MGARELPVHSDARAKPQRQFVQRGGAGDLRSLAAAEIRRTSTGLTMLFTIGHSNHPIEAFIRLLQGHGVTAVGDVRSHPYSRYAPQYSRDPLKVALAQKGIAYVFLDKELGARSKDPGCYKEGKVQYDRLARQPQFAEGISRVTEGMKQYCIALMCAEKDPLECHRTLLVARKLHEAGVGSEPISTSTAHLKSTERWNLVFLSCASCRKETCLNGGTNSFRKRMQFRASEWRS